MVYHLVWHSALLHTNVSAESDSVPTRTCHTVFHTAESVRTYNTCQCKPRPTPPQNPQTDRKRIRYSVQRDACPGNPHYSLVDSKLNR